MDHLLDPLWAGQDALYAHAIQPLLYRLGFSAYLEDAYDATGWLLLGVLQIALLLCVGPLERRWPAEPVSTDTAARRQRRRAIATDVIYTLIDRLGVIRLAVFFAIDPLWNALFGRMTIAGWDGIHLDQWIAPWWPGVTDQALAGLAVYLLAFDLLGFVLHRAQHRFEWWWALHAVHHSQRHMTVWSDSRNHLLDTVLIDAVLAVCTRMIGAAPAQFVVVATLTKLIESLSHANLRLPFGRFGERLLVGPAYHRMHHAIAVGHESAGRGSLGGCNHAVMFPVWDLLFGVARFDRTAVQTGIRDQLPEEGGRDYGEGFWDQQWKGVERMMNRPWMVSLSMLLLGFAAPPAEAHAHLKSSSPAEASTLESAPTSVTLVFSEGATLTALTLQAKGEGSARKLAPDAAGAVTSHTISLPAIGAGDYVLTWRALSDDTHVTSGTLHFSVHPAATAKP